MTSLVCLDLGTTTGYAILDQNKRTVQSGSICFRTGRFTGGGMRFLKFREFLEQINETRRISRIVFEEVRNHKGVDAAHVYGGMLAILTSWCETLEIPYEGVPVGTIKKSATGKGNASKAEVIKAVQDKGFTPSDDNEADALAILMMVAEGSIKP